MKKIPKFPVTVKINVFGLLAKTNVYKRRLLVEPHQGLFWCVLWRKKTAFYSRKNYSKW